VTEGLVCVFSLLESYRSFAVVPNRMTRRLEIVRLKCKCLHFYLYLIDPEFGWMHVRIQSWALYEIQVYVNGREWLARQMDRADAYQRTDNKIVAVDGASAVRTMCDKLAHSEWSYPLGEHHGVWWLRSGCGAQFIPRNFVARGFPVPG
jgi:ribosome-binding ATPase